VIVILTHFSGLPLAPSKPSVSQLRQMFGQRNSIGAFWRIALDELHFPRESFGKVRSPHRTPDRANDAVFTGLPSNGVKLQRRRESSPHVSRLGGSCPTAEGLTFRSPPIEGRGPKARNIVGP